VPVNELLELVPTLTRGWQRSLHKDKSSMSAASSMCEKAGLDLSFIKAGNAQDL
jgi:hypothetical protein